MSATVALESAAPETAGDDVATTNPMVAEAESEQKETKVTKEDNEEAENANVVQSTLTPALSQREREEAAERIRQSNLPPVLKERLVALVGLSGEAEAGGKVRVPIDEAIGAIEEALPDFLRMDKGRASQPEHPNGDVFFSGEASELSEVQAEELARGQLARSGLLRGQRARVAE